MNYIDLQRRFYEQPKAGIEDPDTLAIFGESKFSGALGWPELLKRNRVVILAEAGSGKTFEMREQANRLYADGKNAFFAPLEALHREGLDAILMPDAYARLEAWKADGSAQAWFFLDSVDELKLTEGKLEQALHRLRREIDGHLDRARILISSRPSDWRAETDKAKVNQHLPVPPRQQRKDRDQPSEEVFLEALRRENSRPTEASPDDNADGPPDDRDVFAVVLLPMSTRQVRLFAQGSGVDDAPALVAEIDRQHAWTFARRPLDLDDLIRIWKASGRLGTRREQHEANLEAKLRDDPDRADRGVLPDTKARLGAKRLALALALTRTQTIRSSEQAIAHERMEGVLDPASILEDWTERERQSLLRRALFDPATYGRIRFHHRSVQEFLAALHLRSLRDKGLSTSALFRLLFSERYGFQVAIPSMRPIAAWLALWDDDVRRELTKREPEALLLSGDPESLTVPARIELLRSFAELYGEGGWRGFRISIDEVRRLAHPDLAATVRQLWGDGPANVDVRELLLDVIWQGAIDDCSDIAEAEAFNATAEDDHRVVAIQALLACGRLTAVRRIADDILKNPSSWPDYIVYRLATDLFPTVLSVDEVITLMEQRHESKSAANGFDGASQQIARTIDLGQPQAVELCNKLADLIWRGRKADQSAHQIFSRFGHLCPALAILCGRQLDALKGSADPGLLRACVVATRFNRDHYALREPAGQIGEWFQQGATRRRDAFWAELAFMDECVPTPDDWNRLFNTEHKGLIGHLLAADRTWLEEALEDEEQPARRPIALHGLISIWAQGGRDKEELEELRRKVKDNADLDALLTERTTPSEPSPKIVEMEEEHRRLDREQSRQEAQRIEGWKKWRNELKDDPERAFNSDKQPATIQNIYKWLRAQNPERNKYTIWNKDALIQAFGTDVAEHAADALKAFWRKMPPKYWSARTPADRDTMLNGWIYGLCGLAAEAETPNWWMHLTPEEARIAAAYSTIELNGFTPFIVELAAAFPADVEAVLGEELDAQLKIGGDSEHLPLLMDLSHADASLKELLALRLLKSLAAWPSDFTDITGPSWALHLDRVLRILGEVIGEDQRQVVANECARRYETDPSGPLALTWLRGLFRFDPERGTEAISQGLAEVDAENRQEFAVNAFAALFGDREGILFEIEAPDRRAHALGRLVRDAYAYIRREDDQFHEDTYSPDTRDDAQSARQALLSALLETPGPEACRIIQELASEPNFQHFPDRLRLLARERAGTDAEFPAYDAAAVADLESRYETPPHDRDGLFAIMMDRLDDLAHDVAHDDFTDRRTLQRISEEPEMQRTLARRLKDKANGAYIVTREDEVADRKETDIRLSAVRGDQKAAIEVKIADQRWSRSDLERALRNQLVGQYLRHETCKAGCLLLTYNGEKKYWVHPITKKHLDFTGLVAYLNNAARELEIESNHGFRLTVFGLDLTDPVLAPAHRAAAPIPPAGVKR